MYTQLWNVHTTESWPTTLSFFCNSSFLKVRSNDQNGRFQNRAISGKLGKIARFAIHAKPGIVLIEFVLSGDLLYKEIENSKKTIRLLIFMRVWQAKRFKNALWQNFELNMPQNHHLLCIHTQVLKFRPQNTSQILLVMVSTHLSDQQILFKV